MEKINFTFLGTPDIASKTLDILFDRGYIPSLIITGSDKRSGRGLEINETPVSLWAKEHKIKCLKPEKIDEKFRDEMSNSLPRESDTPDLSGLPRGSGTPDLSGLPRGSATPDLYVVVAYGKILPKDFINIPKLGTINIHYSLLPKYRGASPLEQTLLNGDTETGVSIQQMAFKLDSGPIIASRETLIDINEIKDDLRARLIKLGGDLLCEILPNIIHNNITPTAQDESLATYCTKIKKEDGEIDINGNSEANYNKYRAYYGWPGVYFFINIRDKKTRIKIVKAKYENHSFIIERVIPEGRKEINYSDFLKNIS